MTFKEIIDVIPKSKGGHQPSGLLLQDADYLSVTRTRSLTLAAPFIADSVAKR